MDARLLTVAEVSKWLSISEGTIRFWLRRRLLSKVHVGPRAVRIPQSEVEALIRQGSVPARLVQTTSEGTPGILPERDPENRAISTGDPA